MWAVCCYKGQKEGVEHVGHTEWVANTLTQARGWTVAGPPGSFRPADQSKNQLKYLDCDMSPPTHSLPQWTLK